jgi:hypothetical protein
MKEPVVLSPEGDNVWSAEEMLSLVDSIRWFRGIGTDERRAQFIADEVPRYELSDELFETLQSLQSLEAVDEEILIYASDYDFHWTWRVLPSPFAFAVWQNVDRLRSSTNPAA